MKEARTNNRSLTLLLLRGGKKAGSVVNLKYTTASTFYLVGRLDFQNVLIYQSQEGKSET